MLYLLDVSTCGRGGAASPVGSTLVCGGATGVPAHMIVVGTSAAVIVPLIGTCLVQDAS